MFQKLVACAGLALMLGACAMLQPEEKLTAQPQAPGVELIKQQNGRFIAFIGPRRQHTEPFLGVPDTNYFALRSWLDNKTQETAHQLYVADSYYGGPFSWNGVQDLDGKTLKFIPISRNQISCDEGCSYADEFAVELSEDYLRAHQSGIAVTFLTSEGKKLAVNVPGEFVTEEIVAVDTVRAVAAKAAANPPAATDGSAPATAKPTANGDGTPAAAAPATPAPTTAQPTPAAVTPAAATAAPAQPAPAAATSTTAKKPLIPGTVLPPPPPDKTSISK